MSGFRAELSAIGAEPNDEGFVTQLISKERRLLAKRIQASGDGAINQDRAVFELGPLAATLIQYYGAAINQQVGREEEVLVRLVKAVLGRTTAAPRLSPFAAMPGLLRVAAGQASGPKMADVITKEVLLSAIDRELERLALQSASSENPYTEILGGLTSFLRSKPVAKKEEAAPEDATKEETAYYERWNTDFATADLEAKDKDSATADHEERPAADADLATANLAANDEDFATADHEVLPAADADLATANLEAKDEEHTAADAGASATNPLLPHLVADPTVADFAFFIGAATG